MNKQKNTTLILGLGNDILTDDGIGPKLVRNLQRDLAQPNLAFQTAVIGGLEILELIRDYGRVIIIDAIKTSYGIPGMVYNMTPEDFKETLHLSNFHDVNFLAALNLAEQMDISLPKQINIVAIEIVEDLVFSNEFSQPIVKKYRQIYREVLTAVRKMI